MKCESSLPSHVAESGVSSFRCDVSRIARNGFTITALAVREGPNAAIDRVNMYVSALFCQIFHADQFFERYASFWQGVKN